METDIPPDFERQLERRMDAAVLRYKVDRLFERYGLPVMPVPLEYSGDQWQELAISLALKHEPEFENLKKIRSSPGAPTKWNRKFLLKLWDSVQAVKKQYKVKSNKEAVSILTTKFAAEWGPAVSPGKQKKRYTLAEWQEHLTKRVTDAKNEARKPAKPLGLLFYKNPENPE